MRGGLVLSKGLKITQIPQEVFCKTQHDFMYLLCNHAVMVALGARLGYDFGSTITGGVFSIISNGIDQGSEYVTYPGKIVTVVCSYYSSERALGHWRSEDGALVLPGLSGEAGTKAVEQQNVLPTDKKAQFLIALLLAIGCSAVIVVVAAIRRRRNKE